MGEIIPLRNLSSKEKMNLALLALVLILISVISLISGPVYTSFKDLLRVLSGENTTDIGLIIGSIRLPRIVIGIMSGALLAIAGNILQIVTRNYLMSPELIGFTGGATLSSILYVTYFAVNTFVLPFISLGGALLVGFVIYTLSIKSNLVPIRLVLIGVSISSLLGSLLCLMLMLSPNEQTSNEAYVWITGSIYSVTWINVLTFLPWFVVLLLVSITMSRSIGIIELGNLAQSVGLDYKKTQLLLILTCICMTAACVFVAGGIGFEGLIAPHIARKLIKQNTTLRILASGLVGSILVVSADLIGRVAFSPLDIPCGVITAMIGAPFFFILILRSRKDSGDIL